MKLALFIFFREVKPRTTLGKSETNENFILEVYFGAIINNPFWLRTVVSCPLASIQSRGVEFLGGSTYNTC